jgi:HAMP domain-containing protein
MAKEANTKTTKTPRKRRFIGLGPKLLVIFTLLFTVAFAATFYWFYQYSTETAMQRIRDDMVDTLQGGLQGMSGEEFLALSKLPKGSGADGFPDSELYTAHQQWLSTIHKLEPRAYPYTLIPVPGKPRAGYWIGDILRVVREKSDWTFWQDYFERDGSKLPDGFETLTVDLVPYEDSWGHWVSAYAPILTSSGEHVGVMGVDFEANYVFEVQQAIKDRMLLAFALIYMTLFALIFLISRAVTRPVRELTEMARHVAEGEYTQDFSVIDQGRFQDEIGVLADVFQSMVGKVEQREQNLLNQVVELKIEIDGNKRQKQVAEITETEFFKELKVKARVMRDRANRETPEVSS